jgi:hypothetical protein
VIFPPDDNHPHRITWEVDMAHPGRRRDGDRSAIRLTAVDVMPHLTLSLDGEEIGKLRMTGPPAVTGLDRRDAVIVHLVLDETSPFGWTDLLEKLLPPGSVTTEPTTGSRPCE